MPTNQVQFSVPNDNSFISLLRDIQPHISVLYVDIERMDPKSRSLMDEMHVCIRSSTLSIHVIEITKSRI